MDVAREREFAQRPQEGVGEQAQAPEVFDVGLGEAPRFEIGERVLEPRRLEITLEHRELIEVCG